MDANTRRNLELTQPLRFDGSRKSTLLYYVDKTRTSMGSRMLREWLDCPLRSEEEINRRLDATDCLKAEYAGRQNLIEQLKSVYDIDYKKLKNNGIKCILFDLDNTLIEYKQKEPSNQQKLEEANSFMQQMNFIKAEKQYKSILETCGKSSSQFMINLLNNYSICLLNQRKFEESANLATKIILEYDNKNKRAYLTMLIILNNIKEYKKALELIERVNALFKKPKDIEYFKSIINDINNAIGEDEENKMREI